MKHNKRERKKLLKLYGTFHIKNPRKEDRIVED